MHACIVGRLNLEKNVGQELVQYLTLDEDVQTDQAEEVIDSLFRLAQKSNGKGSSSSESDEEDSSCNNSSDSSSTPDKKRRKKDKGKPEAEEAKGPEKLDTDEDADTKDKKRKKDKKNKKKTDKKNKKTKKTRSKDQKGKKSKKKKDFC